MGIFVLHKIKHTMVNFLIKNLVAMHQGEILLRIKGAFYLSLAGSPILWATERLTDWYLENYGYVVFVFIAIILDHILGTWVHWHVKRDFSIKRNITGFFTKTLLVIFVAILVEGMTTILGEHNLIREYFAIVSRLMVFIYPAGSAMVNVSILTDGKFPPTRWMKQISRFNASMDPKEFGPGSSDPKNHEGDAED